MAQSDSVSYIMPAYNCADTIEASIASILDGNLAPGDEVSVVDDASTDDTLGVVEGLAGQHDGIIVLRHLLNKGSAAAGRNTAIERACNGLVFCLDADNILVPGSVAKLKEHLLGTGADAAAFGEIRFFGDRPRRGTHKWVCKEGAITLSDALCGKTWPGPSGNYLYTTESWLRAGRYNESIGGAYDSWAFGIQQLATGSRMVTLSDAFYYHRYGHKSAFVRDAARSSSSLLALRVLIPYLDLIEEEDREYVMGPEGRYVWFEKLDTRPIRIKGLPPGQDGRRVALRRFLLHRAIAKAERLLGRWCGP